MINIRNTLLQIDIRLNFAQYFVVGPIQTHCLCIAPAFFKDVRIYDTFRDGLFFRLSIVLISILIYIDSPIIRLPLFRIAPYDRLSGVV